MNTDNDMRDRLDAIIRLVNSNLKLCKSLVSYLSNSNMDVQNRLDGLDKRFDEMKNEIHRLDKLSELNAHIYTDEEIYKLKKCMSWNTLNRKTNIPLSTLQYRYRRYKKNQHDENEED